MVDPIHAEDGVERPALERQITTGVGAHKRRSFLKTRIYCRTPSGRHRLFVKLHSNRLAIGQAYEVQHRTTRPAGDIEEVRRRPKLEQRPEALKLVYGEPAVLPNIDPKSLAPHIAVHIRCKVPIVSAVMLGDLRLRAHYPSLRPNGRPESERGTVPRVFTNDPERPARSSDLSGYP